MVILSRIAGGAAIGMSGRSGGLEGLLSLLEWTAKSDMMTQS
jgi:hypothetical protein